MEQKAEFGCPSTLRGLQEVKRGNSWWGKRSQEKDFVREQNNSMIYE